MSDKSLARRVGVQIYFEGCDITDDIRPFLLSLTYTDNEEDETDDLQVTLEDRDGLWQNEWLNSMLQAAVSDVAASSSKPWNTSGGTSGSGSSGANASNRYKVISQNGVHARSRPGTQYYSYGTLAYGSIITVKSISDGWANFDYDKKNAYCEAKYLQKLGSGTNGASGNANSTPQKGASGSGSADNVESSSNNDWQIGDKVIANGRPQYSSWGNGTPGAAVSNYHGSITNLNLKSGIPYPVCVGNLGWFALDQVESDTASGSSANSGNNGKGLKIQAVMARQNWLGDGKDELLECGQFELDGITTQGPPATVTIKATSLPYNSTVRKTKKNKVWENISLSGIQSEMAHNNNMGCMFLCSANPFYERREQYGMSDIEFLQQLCHDAGASLKATNNMLVVFDQAEYESNPPVKTIGRGCGYLKYKFSTNENDTYTSCCVSYTRVDGNVISATAYVDDYDKDSENNQCLKLHRKVANKEEALNLAYKMLRLHNKYEYEASFTFPFEPALCAGCTVGVSDDWGLWAGKYIIKQSKHKIGSDSSTTQISMRRVIG